MACLLLVTACDPSPTGLSGAGSPVTMEAPSTTTSSVVTTASSSESMSRFPIATITIGDDRLGVWVADDGGERRQGLMGVDELPEGIEGMIFVYPAPGRASFHMKDTLIPLDIWWFDADMRLIGTAEMEPCSVEPCTSYASPGVVQWVLETPQGARQFQPGARLSIVESG